MATPNKTKKKRTVSRKTAGKKPTLKKRADRRKLAERRGTSVKKAQKKRTSRKPAAQRKAQRTVWGNQNVETVAAAFERRRARSGEQSGDLQGLSATAEADSESVEELLEEGNTFEAGVVKGVEDADDAGGAEVHTHEVPEDDVPDEYEEEE